MRLQNRRVFGAGVSALGAVLVLAGCGAGQITQTDTQQPAVNGTYATVKTLALRNVAIQYPAQGAAYSAGQSAPLTLTIANQGAKDDQLLSISSDGTQSPAQIGGATDIVAGHTLVIGPDDAVESTNEQAPPATSSSAEAPATGTSSTGAPSSSASASPGDGGAVATPLNQGTASLQGLKQPLWPGMTINVTFTFRDAGPITVEVPVAAPAHVEP
ncbi:hypothetical protein VSH64_33255 [Amycolatopsis rhabdoformis]|uniref:Copper chaperone PCu(A)C n=1 Tax=Amycolatopsis rhabdoformis TaxID=1448059 RepID=A0ABZ1I0G8_9PSEU|nr:hypothetical protein [Amycolatopsis rhabdoformis]WSE27695.1 hypothetical protein VSH64_33255 [Amycolatopsis rhabdoformis]